MESVEGFIGRLPKVELHVHLVGSASVGTVLELVGRHPGGAGAAGVPESAAELADFYAFRDFPHFAEVYGAVSSLVRDPADVAALVLGAARDLAGQNVRYAELTVTPYTFTAAGMPAAELTEALDIAARSAARDYGITMAYIFDVAGEYGEPAARATLEHALSCPPGALTGFGLAGIEQARPRFAARLPLGVRRGDRGRAAQRAARGRDVGSRDDLGGAGRPAGRADRARHQLPGRPGAGGPAAGEPDPARGVPDVQRVHPAGHRAGRSTRCRGCSRRACS